jgi:hypothetical protein
MTVRKSATAAFQLPKRTIPKIPTKTNRRLQLGLFRALL